MCWGRGTIAAVLSLMPSHRLRLRAVLCVVVFSLENVLHLFIHFCVSACLGMSRVPQPVLGAQSTWESCFSPSTLWVWGMKLRVWCETCHWALSPLSKKFHNARQMSSSNLLLPYSACSYLLKWGPESVLCKHDNCSSDLSADVQGGYSPTSPVGWGGDIITGACWQKEKWVQRPVRDPVSRKQGGERWRRTPNTLPCVWAFCLSPHICVRIPK